MSDPTWLLVDLLLEEFSMRETRRAMLTMQDCTSIVKVLGDLEREEERQYLKEIKKYNHKQVPNPGAVQKPDFCMFKCHRKLIVAEKE